MLKNHGVLRSYECTSCGHTLRSATEYGERCPKCGEDSMRESLITIGQRLTRAADVMLVRGD